MNTTVLELLKFYQKEVSCSDAQSLLERLKIINPEVVNHFGLGYCSGKAYEVASDDDREELKEFRLVRLGKEIFRGRIVFPVYDSKNQLVDLWGVWYQGGDKRYKNWQTKPRGLIGIQNIWTAKDLILTDSPHLALQVVQNGFQNVISLRHFTEIHLHLNLLKESHIESFFILSLQHSKDLQKAMVGTGKPTYILKSKMLNGQIDPAVFQPVEDAVIEDESVNIELVSNCDGRMVFKSSKLTYRVVTISLASISMKVQVRVEQGDNTFLDKLDLSSSSARSKFSKHCGMAVKIAPTIIESDLTQIATTIDDMQNEEEDIKAKQPQPLKEEEEQEALRVLKTGDVLSEMTKALTDYSHYAGEGTAKQLGILVATSRLLEQPLAAVVVAPSGAGKSSLMKGIAALLPIHQVLWFSRITSQSLYYLKAEHLKNKLLIVDEWSGLEEAEYSIRTMLTSQCLSLAITIREGGRTPVTKLVEVPAVVSLMVSSTQAINIENASRMLTIKLHGGKNQTEDVMKYIANRYAKDTNHVNLTGGGIELCRNINTLLKPCRVVIPFANRIKMDANRTMTRRHYGQLMNLISAHAVLNQYQRPSSTAKGITCIEAIEDDYRAIEPLLADCFSNGDEELSPAAHELLESFKMQDEQVVTRKEIMNLMGWSYGKTWRTIKELLRMDLLQADSTGSGVLKRYAISEYDNPADGTITIS